MSEYYVCVLQTIVEENRVERERVRKKELIEHLGGDGGGRKGGREGGREEYNNRRKNIYQINVNYIIQI